MNDIPVIEVTCPVCSSPAGQVGDDALDYCYECKMIIEGL